MSELMAPILRVRGADGIVREITAIQGAPGKAATIEIVGTETLEAGQPAAVEEVEGSTPQARKYIFKVPQGKPGATPNIQIGSGLKLDAATNTLSVDTADAVEQDNTKPITSAAVFVEVGNIEALLAAL